MANGLTNAKGASGSKAELIWSGSANDVTINYGGYSQLLICSVLGKAIIDISTTELVYFGISSVEDSKTSEIALCNANTSGRIRMMSAGIVNFKNNTLASTTFNSFFTEIYGIKDALV